MQNWLRGRPSSSVKTAKAAKLFQSTSTTAGRLWTRCTPSTSPPKSLRWQESRGLLARVRSGSPLLPSRLASGANRMSTGYSAARVQYRLKSIWSTWGIKAGMRKRTLLDKRQLKWKKRKMYTTTNRKTTQSRIMGPYHTSRNRRYRNLKNPNSRY